MDKIHEIAGGGALMPRFDDGMVNMTELIRVMAESLVNEIMDAQADEACESGNQRNGYRERRLVTSVGTINLRIPKLRAGSYFPEDLIERYSRVDRAVIAAVSEMVADGVPARKARRAAQSMGTGRMGAGQMSRMCTSLDDAVADLQERDLSDVSYPYIWLDATYIKCRDAGRVQSTALVTAIGAGSGGYRRLLGLDAIDTESHGGWRAFLLSLRARGVDGVICVTGDAHGGLRRAIQEVFPGAAWQRCVVHLMRDAALPRADQAEGGRRARRPEGRFRRARPRARARALPARHRADRGVLPQGGRGARGGRGRRAGVPGLPLRAPREAAHRQRSGARQPRAQAPQPRRAGVPGQEVAHRDDGGGALRDGRGWAGRRWSN